MHAPTASRTAIYRAAFFTVTTICIVAAYFLPGITAGHGKHTVAAHSTLDETREPVSQEEQIPRIDAAEIDESSGQPLHWLSDLEEAKTLARETNKPLFVVIRCER